MPKRILLLLFLVASFLPAREGRSDSPFDQEKCSLCHIRESVFFSPSYLSAEALKDFDEARLCGSCHNGSVQDDRSQLWRGAQHPSTGGERGRKCSRCHSPHSKGGWGVLAGTGVSIHRGGDALCTGCHTAFAGRSAFLHQKNLEGGCRECHQVHGGQGKFLLREAGGGPCMRCHADKASQKSGGHPAPAAGGPESRTSSAAGCLQCHPAHRPDEGRATRISRCSGCHPTGGTKTPTPGKGHYREEECGICHTYHSGSGEGGKGFRGKDIRTGILCGSCHPRYFAGDVAAGRSSGTHLSVTGETADICLRCHRMHDAPSGSPLLRSAKSYFCLECHDRQNTIREVGDTVQAHPVFEKVARGRLTGIAKGKKLVLGPAGEITCQTCHKLHYAAAGTPLLAPGTDKAESCFFCHEGMRGKIHKGKGAETVADCADCHPVHGRKDAGGDPWAGLCQTCHPRPSSHRLGKEDRSVSRSPGLPEFDARGRKTAYGAISCPTCHQAHGEPIDARRVRKNYRPNGFLCTSCHGKEESVALTPHDLRGVVGNSVCEPCHVPHGGTSPWMWGFRRTGSEGGEETCRACHGGKGMGTAVPKGGHPMNRIPSRPLPERFPLVGPDGTESRVGVISCPTCHDVHGTGILPTGQGVGKLLRQPPGGGRTSLCAECHAGMDDRHGKADCLACHPPHGGETAGPACDRCHESSQGALFGKHKEAGKGCGACHRVHVAANAKGGNPERGGAKSCYVCHPSTRRIAGTPHAELGGSECDACHPVHADKRKFEGRSKLGEDAFAPDLACLGCHREGGDAPVPPRSKHPNHIKEVPTTYGAKVTLETPIAMVGKHKEGGRPLFPLFDEAGKPSLSGRMGCLTCHDPHAGGKGVGETAPRAYLRDPALYTLTELCATCHHGEASNRLKGFHAGPRKEP